MGNGALPHGPSYRNVRGVIDSVNLTVLIRLANGNNYIFGVIVNRTSAATLSALICRLDNVDWPGLKGVIMVESTREIADKIERETRFYITSLVWLAHALGPVIRSHRAVENSLHWVMDMIFRDDECRIRTDHAPANFTTLKHMAHNLIRKAPGKDSMRLKRKVAAWDDDFLASLIAA
jgi:predicted transposase YbfD/YdcC